MKLRSAVVSIFLIAASVYIYSRLHGEPRIALKTQEAHRMASTPGAPVSVPKVFTRAIASNSETRWKRFKDGFGPDLEAEFLPGGALSAVRGRPGDGSRAGTEFRTDDPSKVIARAREILEQAGPMIGLDPDFPLSTPWANPGPVSAQVVFREMRDGVAVAPLGNITIDLGPSGELLRLDSSYAPGIRVVNQLNISSEIAKQNAIRAVNDAGAAVSTEGGNRVIWVSQNSEGGFEGRQAYQFLVQGRQVIIDASTGEVIFKRDRRVF